MRGHTQNFSLYGPSILHLPGGGLIQLTQMWSWDPLTIRVKLSQDMAFFEGTKQTWLKIHQIELVRGILEFSRLP